jgi:hypothetical protein
MKMIIGGTYDPYGNGKAPKFVHHVPVQKYRPQCVSTHNGEPNIATNDKGNLIH